MPTWSPSPSVWGAQQSSGSGWSSSPSSVPGGASVLSRWTAAPFPSGTTILSATFSMARAGGGFPRMRAYVQDADTAASPPVSLTSLSWTTYDQQAGTSSGWSHDLTSLVQQVVNRPGWGGTLLVRHSPLEDDGAVGVSAPTLVVEYEHPVQFLASSGPVAAVPRVLGPLTVDLAATTAGPVLAQARVLVPDVVAPVALAAPTVPAPARALPPVLSGTGDAPPLDVAGRLTATAGVLNPSLARTIPPEPPPIPWERLIEDPAYHEALRGRWPVTRSRAEVISPDDTVIARLGGPDATHPGALSGAVTCNGSASIRWDCNLVLDNPDLMPRAPSDMLHPLSHNRVRIWWGIRLPDGTWGEIPVGTYHPDLTPTSDDGTILAVRIKGSSAVAEVKRARWDDALDLSGATISEAISTILADRAPWAKVAVTPTTQKVPSAYEPGAPGEDPWEDVERLAEAAGMVAYEDRMGVIRVDPRPTVGPPRASFVEGVGTTLVELSSVETDLDWIVNKVTVVSASPDVDPPVTGVATDDDPSSPLWVGRGHLYTMRVANAIITTEQAATTMARNILADRAPVVTVSAVVSPHPHLDPGDTIAIGRARAGAVGDHTLAAWTLGLESGAEMRITATSKKEMPR